MARYEAEKEIKGFSRAEFKGYTAGDGGRARAEGEFLAFANKSALREEIPREQACRTSEENAKFTPSKEPIHVHVSAYVPQSRAPRHCVAQQLQTPPNTITEKKKERPLSWEAKEESQKKAKRVNNDTLEGTTIPMSERTLVHIKSRRALSATASLCDVECSTENSSVAGEAGPDPECSDITSEDTGEDDPSCSDDEFGSTVSDGNSAFGDVVGEADSKGQVFVATDSEDDSGLSTILVHNRGSEDENAGKEIYPQLPVHKESRSSELEEIAFQDNVTFDHFSPALDYIALEASSDYGDFPDDVAVLDSSSINGRMTEPRLCDEQLALVELVMNGTNVFYTGSAGCGKSTVLKHFVSLLRGEGKNVVKLAPTGRAALQINGRTLHNYAGWVPRSLGQPLESLERHARGTKVCKRLKATDVLIIDEISMVANHVFERLNYIMKAARGNTKPFGGVQIILTGDFFQLPPVNAFEYCLICGTTLGPVSRIGEYNCVKCSAQFKETDKWAFCSTAWKECEFAYLDLKVIHRQKDDEFKALLEKCRLGISFSVDEERVLLEHESDTRDAVKLFPRKVDVKAINDGELEKLPTRALTYLCVDNFWTPDHETFEDKRIRCPEPMSHALEALEEHSFEPKLVLKEGMLVMLLVNWDTSSSLINGSQGTIVGFEKHDPDKLREVRHDWEYSSRKNGLIRVFVQRTAVQEWPKVKFLNGVTNTIYPRCMVNELGDDKPYSLLSRTQIPLTAAWAMTVHKAQGMTLSRVIVDLSHSFEPGQAYVALSRAENLKGLKVEGLPKKNLGPNKQVVRFKKEHGLMPDVDWDEGSDVKSE